MLPIQKLFVNYNYSVRNEKIKYIVIHDVGEPSSARNNRDYFSGGDRGASADFFVDSTNIIQLFDYTKYYSWAVGDGQGKYGITNKNSVSIEMCLEKDFKPSDITIKNTIDLAKMLMKELNIPIENVVRHYDASRKNCPQSFSADNWSEWKKFKEQLAKNNMSVPLTIIKETPCIDKNGAIAKTFKPGDKVTAMGEDRGYWILSIGKIPKVNCKEINVSLTIIKETPCIDKNGAVAKTFKPGDKVTAIDEDRGYWILSIGKIPKANCNEN